MMSEQKAEDLIQKIINFIENERELYGEFSIQKFTPGSDSEISDPQQSSDMTVGKKPFDNQSPNVAPEPMNEKSSDTQEAVFGKQSPADIYSHIDKCNSLEELEELCKKADVLRTDLEGTRLVFGTGNPNADLMLIGEAPGAEEDKQGEPFVGAAGRLLNKILAAVDFKREDVYIANILKHRPPNNRNPLPEERERSLPFLLRQIDLVNPKLILALGKVAAQTLLDSSESLGKMRGRFHPVRKNYELLATYHPAALLRYDKWKRPTWEDVQLLRERYDELNGKP